MKVLIAVVMFLFGLFVGILVVPTFKEFSTPLYLEEEYSTPRIKSILIGFGVCYLWNPIYGVMILGAYYLLIGFALSRFVTASYTNGVFDKYLNSRIEGAKVNQGLRQDTDDDDEEDEEETEQN